ncbi:MAG: alpha/beta hydrolase [Chloroflexi bacterium]|nr:alpha/beta hydrolase [Chloroflexota bacterium]
MTISNRIVDLYYECSGAGPDVLLVHGWASSGRMWDRLVRDMRHEVRFWSVDLPGFGASTLSQDALGIDINGHMAALFDFCDQQRIRPQAVIGHSMGGMIALKMALARPRMLHTLLLVCPCVTGRFAFNTHQLFNSSVARFLMQNSKRLWEVAQSDFWKQWLPMALYADKAADERVQHDFQRMSWQSAVSGLDSMARENLGPYLERIKHPALVIVGGSDYTVPPDEGRLAAGCLPNGRLLEFDTAHHQPLDEEPERFAAAVRAFLQAQGVLTP